MMIMLVDVRADAVQYPKLMSKCRGVAPSMQLVLIGMYSRRWHLRTNKANAGGAPVATAAELLSPIERVGPAKKKSKIG